MKEQEKTTLRKLRREKAESFFLIIRGAEVGVFAGLVCVLYRFLLSQAETMLYKVIDAVKGNPIKSTLWIAALAILGALVALIIKAVPDSGGSGIPQVNGEIKGYLSPSWWRVIIAKLVGSTASIFSGLALGREGPSIQFGAMAAKGVARITKADKTTELRMISCGAGAGLAAAFNAPLAGIVFVLEEIYKTFDKAILCMGIVAAVTADFVSKLFFGQDTVFSYDSVTIPLRWYWLLIIMGAVCGLFGVISNVLMIGFRDIVAKITKIPNTIKMAAGFAISGIVGLLMPQILCGGHRMSELLINEHPAIGAMVILLLAKFIFGIFSFGTGAPGGTLYPLCVLGAYLGAIYGRGAIDIFGLDQSLWQEFVVLGMAGLFASIVRAPITGVILVFEITGNASSLLPLVVVSLISYALANMTGNSPFYAALLDRTVKHEGIKEAKAAEKVLETFVIPQNSPVCGKTISQIKWGKHCLIVSVERDETPITPKGDTELKAGDILVIMISQRHFALDYGRIERIINGRQI